MRANYAITDLLELDVAQLRIGTWRRHKFKSFGPENTRELTCMVDTRNELFMFANLSVSKYATDLLL